MMLRALFIVVAIVGVGFGAPQDRNAGGPKYIFLMIGDGMGHAQRQVAERYPVMKGVAHEEGLVMNRLPVKGMTSTHDATTNTTDSAASGTALATGYKTCNGVLGLSADLSTPLRSVAYDARDAGMRVGIITTVPIDHATPAAFYAQVKSRGMSYEIDTFLAKSGFDYFAGEPMDGRRKAKEQTPPEELAMNAGYRLVGDRAAFDDLKPGCGKVLVEHSMGYVVEGKPEISLADYTRKGIELLDGEHGFFMMVEGGKIDWCCHANDLAACIHETLAFNEAVEVAYAFCRRHPQEALLIVTADHETGGIKLANGENFDRMVQAIDAQKFQSAHYAHEVEQWMRGGRVDADEAFRRLMDSFAFGPLSETSEDHLRRAITATMQSAEQNSGDPELQKMYGKKNMAVVSCLYEVAARAGTGWSTFGHTNARVETTAFGCGADRFGGENDNTDIGKNLRALLAERGRP